jgi:hypothetical protein
MAPHASATAKAHNQRRYERFAVFAGFRATFFLPGMFVVQSAGTSTINLY